MYAAEMCRSEIPEAEEQGKRVLRRKTSDARELCGLATKTLPFEEV